MKASKEAIANFRVVATDADEKTASRFLEGSNTLDEAVSEYLENPNKYSQASAPSYNQPKSMGLSSKEKQKPNHPPPAYASVTRSAPGHLTHTNEVIQAGHVRAQDEQQMQMLLQQIQFAYGIYNSDIEPEHDTDFYCNCEIHQYQRRKWARLGVQERWSKAVMYPGERSYHDCYQATMFSGNPYQNRIVSPYAMMGAGGSMFMNGYGRQRPSARFYSMSVEQTIRLNSSLNNKAQAAVDALEPTYNIWKMDEVESGMASLSIDTPSSGFPKEKNEISEKGINEKRQSVAGSIMSGNGEGPSTGNSKPSKFSGLKKAFNIKSSEERAVAKVEKVKNRGRQLRDEILREEQGRWPDQEWRRIVSEYQEHIGMTRKVSDLRARQPLQYLHLLRAGYFEPIPVAWAKLASNPLKFSIEAASGWRGITPAWRGYEDTAEERLYWCLNHREGTAGTRLKPDMISALNMARARMASAVEAPPLYFAADDTCHTQHTSEGYSKQVMPPPFRAFDAIETASDDTMILLDVSGSMDFDPLRPNYDQYLITGYSKSTQPKNKDVAKAIIRRFTDAMINHDHNGRGYELVTFATQANYIGCVNHQNLDAMWSNVRIGGGTRVMTGWQQAKELHFQKHSASATHHPVYGWQAGPETPILRLLVLLDGEATDMDEFELDLLSLSWVHVTIFLIGVDGCPHHHRHANELQRISEVNHHVSFVDAQGNTPERFVTHELLKRHLGYEVSMQEFEELELPPPYTA
ncbi:hypothetical protein BT63DRAFT_328406 [Microthyrium microscopicum]|uniref:VWFA domain-containing protein n=1 Tax=Microthyrium microscopicum TaxID=703497 RepID=A0A6A6U4J3_9PEZI|nr:hypothetical protein BT63DRAFT_328406 [Microthyrium microscopicum]